MLFPFEMHAGTFLLSFFRSMYHSLLLAVIVSYAIETLIPELARVVYFNYIIICHRWKTAIQDKKSSVYSVVPVCPSHLPGLDLLLFDTLSCLYIAC